MDYGFIKIHRKMLDWEWYDDINTKVLFIHLLLSVNWEDKQWKGINIERGSILTSLEHLSKETGLTIQNIRTSINKLKSTGELTSKTTSRYSVLKLKNYDYYQANQQASQQTTNKQLTTTKEIQEIKEIKDNISKVKNKKTFTKEINEDELLEYKNNKFMKYLINSFSYGKIEMNINNKLIIETYDYIISKCVEFEYIQLVNGKYEGIKDIELKMYKYSERCKEPKRPIKVIKTSIFNFLTNSYAK